MTGSTASTSAEKFVVNENLLADLEPCDHKFKTTALDYDEFYSHVVIENIAARVRMRSANEGLQAFTGRRKHLHHYLVAKFFAGGGAVFTASGSSSGNQPLATDRYTGANLTSDPNTVSASAGQSHSPRPTGLEKMLTELGRLQDGWAGVGSISPSSDILRDVEHVIAALDQEIETPEFEIDPDDGCVTMFWQGGSQAFSLIVSGNGLISGVLSPYQSVYAPWTLPAAEIEKIAGKLQNDIVQSLIRNT
jgi:hypothetical protein